MIHRTRRSTIIENYHFGLKPQQHLSHNVGFSTQVQEHAIDFIAFMYRLPAHFDAFRDEAILPQLDTDASHVQSQDGAHDSRPIHSGSTFGKTLPMCSFSEERRVCSHHGQRKTFTASPMDLSVFIVLDRGDEVTYARSALMVIPQLGRSDSSAICLEAAAARSKREDGTASVMLHADRYGLRVMLLKRKRPCSKKRRIRRRISEK
jgi:hypothetical protein